mgnify:CR=1 FL=1
MSGAAPRPRKIRVDQLLVDRGLAPTRQKAQALILAGDVWSGDRRIDKAGDTTLDDAEIRVAARKRFVSRGGDKLEGALASLAGFDDLAGRTAVDVGASTGGFTDCLLSRGATRVYAVDVGWGQLDATLRSDPRVVVRERTNAKTLTTADFAEPIDLVVVDASFIGIDKLIGAIAAFLREGGDLVALIKPQFEAGKDAVSKGKGVIRDEAVRQQAIEGAVASIERAGFTIVDQVDSTVHGPKGNVERFVHARRK